MSGYPNLKPEDVERLCQLKLRRLDREYAACLAKTTLNTSSPTGEVKTPLPTQSLSKTPLPTALPSNAGSSSSTHDAGSSSSTHDDSESKASDGGRVQNGVRTGGQSQVDPNLYAQLKEADDEFTDDDWAESEWHVFDQDSEGKDGSVKKKKKKKGRRRDKKPVDEGQIDLTPRRRAPPKEVVVKPPPPLSSEDAKALSDGVAALNVDMPTPEWAKNIDEDQWMLNMLRSTYGKQSDAIVSKLTTSGVLKKGPTSSDPVPENSGLSDTGAVESPVNDGDSGADCKQLAGEDEEEQLAGEDEEERARNEAFLQDDEGWVSLETTTDDTHPAGSHVNSQDNQ